MMKENIESLLEGTSIPKYITLFYAVMIIVISSILSVGFYQDLHQQKQRFSAVIDTNYHVKIDPDTADSIVCYQHRLHYRNLTFFRVISLLKEPLVAPKYSMQYLKKSQWIAHRNISVWH